MPDKKPLNIINELAEAKWNKFIKDPSIQALIASDPAANELLQLRCQINAVIEFLDLQWKEKNKPSLILP